MTNPTSLAGLYRKLWSAGDAGTEIVLNLRRDGEDIDVNVETGSRYSFLENAQTIEHITGKAASNGVCLPIKHTRPMIGF